MVSIFFCRCFGFVVFTTKESLDKVIDPGMIGNHNIDNRRVDVKKAIPHAQHQVGVAC